MTGELCGEINSERVAEFVRKLTKVHATAAVLVGIGHDHAAGQIHIVRVADLTVRDVRALLLAAIRTIDRGEVTEL